MSSSNYYPLLSGVTLRLGGCYLPAITMVFFIFFYMLSSLSQPNLQKCIDLSLKGQMNVILTYKLLQHC